MNETAASPAIALRRRHLGNGIARVVSIAGLLVILLAALAYGAVRWLDSEGGRAFVTRQLPLYAPQSGLTVRAGRIDGSIFGVAIIHDLTLGDPKGVFAVVPLVRLDWRPFDLVRNALTVRSLVAPEVRILRMPALRPSGDKRILPDIDIAIGRLKIDRLILEPAVSGQRRVLGIGGNADIRSGRAKVDLVALTLAETGHKGSGDTIRLKLDIEPDRNRFDMDALVTAPADGAIAGILGLSQPLDFKLEGDGSWQVWRGQLAAKLGGAPLAELGVTAQSGLFSVKGNAMPARLLQGMAARLTGPVLAIDATARVKGRMAAVTARLDSKALVVAARGGLNFGDETINGVTVNARLLQPSAIAANVRGQDVRLTAKLAGTFVDPLIDYRLTAATAAWGTRVATDLRVAGIINAGARPLVIPASVTASRITGTGETAGPLLTNIRIDGPLTIADGRLTSNALRFSSDRLNGTATAVVIFANSDFLLTVNGALPRYAIPELGIADIVADLRIAPAGNGARVTGRTSIKLTRLDNGFFIALTDGLPAIIADIDVAPDLSLLFRNARITSPGLTFAGSGSRSASGLVQMTGAGVSRDYGPLSLVLSGPIEAPVVDVVLAQPGMGIGLAALAVHVAPTADGWAFEANGASDYGPATGRGLIRTGTGPVAIDISSVTIAGLIGRGSVMQTAAGPFAGKIDLSGPGVEGTAVLAAAGALQRADIAMAANQARLALAVPVTIDSGTIRLTALLPDRKQRGGPSATGNFDLIGVERNGVRIDRTQGSLTYANDSGTAKGSASGSTDIPFSISAEASFSPDRIELTGSGTLDKKPIRLSGSAIFTHGTGGWALAPVTVITPEGQAELSGLFGDSRAIHARFDRLAISLLTTAYPTLDVTGRISGTIDIALASGGVPIGSASLRLNSLSRAGIASASLPIDVGINAELTASGAVARAVIVRGGKVEGRAQARVGPIRPGSATLTERLFASPISAQVRYNGPAQAIWGLSGVEAFDVRGPVSIVADIAGDVGDPKLTGTMRSEGARVESTALGAVIDQVSFDSRFSNSRLELTRFSGRVGTDGSITGTGGIDLSAERAFPMDIRLQLKNARLVNRDDFTGSATGNIRIATDPYGGVFSGKLSIDKATYRIGRSTAIAVPMLAVTEKNTKVLQRRVAAYAQPTRWLLNLEVKADRRLFLSGMGVEAEWRGDLKIQGGATTPEVTGRVELVRGDYDFAGKRFSLTKGDIRFSGAYPPDPQIDISATSSASGFTAQLDIDGTAMRPEIKFSSVPSLPEDEVLSRVLFGSSVTSLSAPEAVQLAGALASLRGGGGFNPINSVRKGLGIDRLRILPADTATGRKTAVAAGQYIGRSVYVELATDAQGYTATNIEVSLTRALSILSTVQTLGGTSVSLQWKKDY
jgi:translocation and assembly module TamB